ncbi:MAG: IMP dehydrogenase [Patescibacteria group bacterium]
MNKQISKIDAFFRKIDKSGLALSYKDVRMATGYSDIIPSDQRMVTSSKFSTNVMLKIPIISSPMDTVTEYKMAIAMAKTGGSGIIHKALSPKMQASMIGKVKHHLSAFISDPICIKPDDTVGGVIKMGKEKGYKFYSFLVRDGSGKIIGLVTHNDFDFCPNPDKKISEIMSKEIIFGKSGTTIQQAYKQMLENKKKILPIFNRDGSLKGIYTWADVTRIVLKSSEKYNVDSSGSLIVGAAIGVGPDLEERMELLSQEKVNVVVIDTAHGDSKKVIETIKFCKKYYPHIDVVAGNISEPDSAKRLVKAGVDGIKVGQGPGSICTTRIIAGIGCPQVTAIYNCSKAVRGSGVPICADGGIEFSGDIAIAIAAGADNVMLGSVLAGTTETPGEIIRRGGRTVKIYRGMGSLGAMIDNQASRERYGQGGITTTDKLVPEGIESEVDYKGNVEIVLSMMIGGLRAGMGYVGAKNLSSLHRKANFHLITNSGLTESHPHGLTNIQDAPNYHYRGEKL